MKCWWVYLFPFLGLLGGKAGVKIGQTRRPGTRHAQLSRLQSIDTSQCMVMRFESAEKAWAAEADIKGFVRDAGGLYLPTGTPFRTEIFKATFLKDVVRYIEARQRELGYVELRVARLRPRTSREKWGLFQHHLNALLSGLVADPRYRDLVQKAARRGGCRRPDRKRTTFLDEASTAFDLRLTDGCSKLSVDPLGIHRSWWDGESVALPDSWLALSDPYQRELAAAAVARQVRQDINRSRRRRAAADRHRPSGAGTCPGSRPRHRGNFRPRPFSYCDMVALVASLRSGSARS